MPSIFHCRKQGAGRRFMPEVWGCPLRNAVQNGRPPSFGDRRRRIPPSWLEPVLSEAEGKGDTGGWFHHLRRCFA